MPESQPIPSPRRQDTLAARPDVTPLLYHAGLANHTLTLASTDDTLQAHLDRLTAEFASLKRQLRQAQKLAALGTSAAMIAHEFNNLFTPVVAYAQHALDIKDVQLMQKALTKTVERCATMRNMADRLIGMARQSDGAVKAVNVLNTVAAAVECLGRDPAKDQITVNLQIDPALGVRVNENSLLQILFNLVVNARQAMIGKGRGRLTIDAAPAQEGQVELNVRDNGCGIAPENLPRIFEPFFTTKADADKPDRRGTGLGLSICRDIIEELGGRISVTSQPNAGTVFTITLPAAE